MSKPRRVSILLAELNGQICRVPDLKNLEFDNFDYVAWRLQTGKILDELFGKVDDVLHPCTEAFFNYCVPKNYTASRASMQEYYENIISYQADLLTMCAEEMSHS